MTSSNFQSSSIVRFVALVRSSRSELVEGILRRFRLEFDLACEPRQAEYPSTNKKLGCWTALIVPDQAGKLEELENHAIQLEALYPAANKDESQSSEIEISFGYMDELKVVRATRSNSPERIYLGKDIWGEIMATRRPDGTLQPRAGSDPAWSGDSALSFFASLSRGTNR